jgi:hypothetical protein
MLSAFEVGLVINSSSQRRPRAMDDTSVARFSERIGRIFAAFSDKGIRISRRRFDGALLQGMLITLASSTPRIE